VTRTWAIRVLAACAVLGLTLSAASADENGNHLTATLSGFNETAPPVLSTGTATFEATIQGDSSLTYTLTFSGLQTKVLQSHLHFAERGVNGGVFLFLCTNLGNGPADTPACPQSGTVTRTVTAADIVGGAAGQQLSAGDFAGALRVIRAGDAYANLHTTAFPQGEIRGQVRVADD
jgi:hypothetical protein